MINIHTSSKNQMSCPSKNMLVRYLGRKVEHRVKTLRRSWRRSWTTALETAAAATWETLSILLHYVWPFVNLLAWGYSLTGLFDTLFSALNFWFQRFLFFAESLMLLYSTNVVWSKNFVLALPLKLNYFVLQNRTLSQFLGLLEHPNQTQS